MPRRVRLVPHGVGKQEGLVIAGGGHEVQAGRVVLLPLAAEADNHVGAAGGEGAAEGQQRWG